MKWKKCLNEYLQFTSSSHIEKNEQFNLSELINEIMESNIIMKISQQI